ncbi:MAG: hypothetical protein ACTSPD_09435 [Promethearchaeota archaeon]
MFKNLVKYIIIFSIFKDFGTGTIIHKKKLKKFYDKNQIIEDDRVGASS